METKRLDRSTMFMDIAHTVAKRGTCERLQVGAVLTLKGRPISMGYNGSAKGEQHCNLGCNKNEPCTSAIHAEANAIYFAARNGIATAGAILYVTHSPCMKCAEAIIQSGIEEVIFYEEFRDTEPIRRLQRNDITVTKYERD
jgi:dCMP deaminase